MEIIRYLEEKKKSIKEKTVSESYKTVANALTYLYNQYPKRRRENVRETIFEEMMSENIPNLEKYINL